MKKSSIITAAILVLTTISLPRSLKAQDDKTRITKDSKAAKAAFIKADASMSSLFSNSYGYAIFPNVGKGGFVVGGGSGNGAVYEKGKEIGLANMAQVSVGPQIGGKAYREVIFFESKDAFDRLKDNKLEFSAQISAVAVKSGVSATAKYRDGVMVFTQDKGGLMAEVSVGGQKFTYKPL